jgi:hypothetical protein
MLKILFTILIFIHGLVHTLGFVKAFHLSKVEQLLLPISRPVGAFWLLSAIGFAFSALMFVFGKNWWDFIAVPSVVLSQILIMLSWPDAKFGTIPNLIILVVAVVSIGSFIMQHRFETDGKKYQSYPWKTPVSEYKERNGYVLPSKAKLIYEKSDGDFTYGELEYKEVKYNVEQMVW